MGRMSQASHCSTTASTPGHTRSGFRSTGSLVCAVVILNIPSERAGCFLFVGVLKATGPLNRLEGLIGGRLLFRRRQTTNRVSNGGGPERRRIILPGRRL